MTDIVERLRSGAAHQTMVTTGLVNQAADTIATLRAEVQELKDGIAQLQEIVNGDTAEEERLYARVKELEDALAARKGLHEGAVLALEARVKELEDANAQLQEIVNGDTAEEERLRAEVERLTQVALRRKERESKYEHFEQHIDQLGDENRELRAEVERLTLGRETMGNLWAREKENSASLRAENEKLRAALEDAARHICTVRDEWSVVEVDENDRSNWPEYILNALEGKPLTTYSGACACANPDCIKYGCKLYRPVFPSYYAPAPAPMPATTGAEVFNTLREIVDLKRRVAELEKKMEEKP